MWLILLGYFFRMVILILDKIMGIEGIGDKWQNGPNDINRLAIDTLCKYLILLFFLVAMQTLRSSSKNPVCIILLIHSERVLLYRKMKSF